MLTDPNPKQSKCIRVAMDSHTATPLPDNCACYEYVGDNPACPIPEHAKRYQANYRVEQARRIEKAQA